MDTTSKVEQMPRMENRQMVMVLIAQIAPQFRETGPGPPDTSTATVVVRLA